MESEQRKIEKAQREDQNTSENRFQTFEREPHSSLGDLEPCSSRSRQKRSTRFHGSSNPVLPVNESRKILKSFFLSPDVMTKQAAAEKAGREQRALARRVHKWKSWLFHATDADMQGIKGFDDRKSWLTSVIPLRVKALFEQAKASIDSAEGWPGYSPDPTWSIPTLRGHVYMLDEGDVPQWFPTGPTLKFMNEQTANSVIRQFSNFPMERLHHYAMNGESLHALYTSRKLVDILIHVENRVDENPVGPQLFYAHRIVLCTHSDYFANALLENDIPPYAITDTTLQSVEPQLFVRFLNFAYTGNIDIKLRELSDLKRLANMLQSKTLKAKLMLYMSMTGAMSLDEAMVIMCQEHDMDEKPIAIEVVKTNFKLVLDDPRMYLFRLEDFLDVISGDNVCVRTELDIFWAVLFWVAYDYGNRVNHFPQLMNEVRFTCMTSLELMDCAKVTEIIKLSNKCKKMLINANWVCHVRETGLEDPLCLPEQSQRTCLSNKTRDAPTVAEFDERFLRYTKLLAKRENDLLNVPTQIQNTKINAKRVLFSGKDEYEPRFDDEHDENYPASNLLNYKDNDKFPNDIDSIDGISPGTPENLEQGPTSLMNLFMKARGSAHLSPPLDEPDGEDTPKNEQVEIQSEKKTRKKKGHKKEKEEDVNSKPQRTEDSKSEIAGSPSPEGGESPKAKKKKKKRSKKGGSTSPEEEEDKKSKKKKKGKSGSGGSPSSEEGESKKSKKKSKRDKSGNWKQPHEFDEAHLESSLSGDRNENTVGEVDVAKKNTEFAAAKPPSTSVDASKSKVRSKISPLGSKCPLSVFRYLTVLKAAMKFKLKLNNKNQGSDRKNDDNKSKVNSGGGHRNTLIGLKTNVVARKPVVDVISLWESSVPQTQEIFLLGGSILQPVKQQKIVLTKLGDTALRQSDATGGLREEQPSQVKQDIHLSVSAQEIPALDVEASSPKSDHCLSNIPYSDSSSDIYPSSHTTASSPCQLFSVLDCELTSELTSDGSSLTLKDCESLESKSQVINTDHGSKQRFGFKVCALRSVHLERRATDISEMTYSSELLPQTSDMSVCQRTNGSQEYSLKSKLCGEIPHQQTCVSQEHSLTSLLSDQDPHRQRRRNEHRRGDNTQ